MRQLFFLTAASLMFPSRGQEVSGAGVPFVLTWVVGKCPNCMLTWDLASLQATTRSEAWAIGESWPPPGGQGLGERIILRTEDGGRTWAEIRQSQQYATSPRVSFLDSSRGWMAYTRPLGEQIVLQTQDGGKIWKHASGRFPFFPIFLDASHWVGAQDGHFLQTKDGGRTWSKTSIPHLRDYDAIRCLTRDIVWIAELAVDGFSVFRTTDGGQVWNESRATTPPKPTSIEDLFFLDQDRGWLITWHSMDGSYLFVTTDGGKTWAPEPDRTFQGAHRWAKCVSFLSQRLGFIFEDEDPPGQDSQRNEAVERLSTLSYTSDGGAQWRKLALPNHVSACQVFKGDLLCSASGKSSGLNVLTVHPK